LDDDGTGSESSGIKDSAELSGNKDSAETSGCAGSARPSVTGFERWTLFFGATPSPALPSFLASPFFHPSFGGLDEAASDFPASSSTFGVDFTNYVRI
jgi:hypothetical protein